MDLTKDKQFGEKDYKMLIKSVLPYITEKELEDRWLRFVGVGEGLCMKL